MDIKPENVDSKEKPSFPTKKRNAKIRKLFKNQKKKKKKINPLFLRLLFEKTLVERRRRRRPPGVGGQKTKSSSSAPSSQEVSTPLELNKFLSSSSSSYYLPESIQAVERCLKENRENLREFFSTCYQTLLWQIFNFDESGSGWLQSVYNMRLQALNYSATSSASSGTAPGGTAGTNNHSHTSSSSTLLKKKRENEATVHLLLKFLSPDGPLMKAIFSADSNNLVQFAFPLERLPSKTQRMLQTQQGAMG